MTHEQVERLHRLEDQVEELEGLLDEAVKQNERLGAVVDALKEERKAREAYEKVRLDGPLDALEVQLHELCIARGELLYKQAVTTDALAALEPKEEKPHA